MTAPSGWIRTFENDCGCSLEAVYRWIGHPQVVGPTQFEPRLIRVHFVRSFFCDAPHEEIVTEFSQGALALDNEIRHNTETTRDKAPKAHLRAVSPAVPRGGQAPA